MWMRPFWPPATGLLAALLLASVHCLGGANQTAPSGPGAATGEQLARNPGFEQAEGGAPRDWTQDAQTAEMGTVTQDLSRFRSGRASLRLKPNKRNNDQRPLSVSQFIPAADYRGRKVRFSAFLAAEKGARAGLGLMSFVDGRPADRVFTTPGQAGEWALREGTFTVPDDPSVKLALICVVQGDSGWAWFDDVSITPLGQAAAPGGAADVATVASAEAHLTVDAGDVIRDIPPTLFGTNVEWRWNATSMWLEDSQRVDPVILRLADEMGVTVVRYPGGIFSDTYHWRDGIGPYAKRPEAQHEPDKPAKSRPNFGTDEALKFAQDIGAELLITVNAGSGTAQEAADWVRYVNAKELRVRYWEIGNELYFKGGSGISKVVSVDPAAYAQRVIAFATAMKAADPRIQIGVIGGMNEGGYKQISYPNWNEIVLKEAGEHVDFLAVHNAYAPILTAADNNKSPRKVYAAMLGRPTLIARNLEKQAKQLEQFYPDPAKRPFIGITEWGPIFQFFHEGQYMDHPKTLGSALFVASTMKAFLESPETQLAAFWVLNDYSSVGWIGSANDKFPPAPEWIPTARYYAFQMFSRHFGQRVVRSTAQGPTYDSKRVGWSDSVKGVPYLDVVSSLGKDGRQLFVMVINKHFDESIRASVEIRGFDPSPTGSTWLLSGTGIDAHTGTKVIAVPWFERGKQREDSQHKRFGKGAMSEVTLTSSPADGLGREFSYTFPAHSVTTIVLTRR